MIRHYFVGLDKITARKNRMIIHFSKYRRKFLSTAIDPYRNPALKSSKARFQKRNLV